MEGNRSSSRAPKSAHIIDLRQAAGGAATAAPAQSRFKRSAAKAKAAAKPKRLARAPKPVAAPEPVAEEVQVEAAPVAAASTGREEQLAPVESVAPAASPQYFEAPTERRFWPAFWRFLILLVVFGLILCAGIYIYLKFFSS